MEGLDEGVRERREQQVKGVSGSVSCSVIILQTRDYRAREQAAMEERQEEIRQGNMLARQLAGWTIEDKDTPGVSALFIYSSEIAPYGPFFLALAEGRGEIIEKQRVF